MTEKHLEIKKSRLPGAGKGLFTKKDIAKKDIIVEYKGKVTTWKKIQDNEIFNGYVYYVNRNHVVDAKANIKALGRYANDAKGMTKVAGLRNNAEYITRQKKVYIRATTDIPAGGEILVGYGKEYWDVIRENNKIDLKNAKKGREKKG